ncbi:MAG TPA: hypothetical protein VGG61_01380, partial [Gemmataceae bacterium]
LAQIAAHLRDQGDGERVFCRFEWGEYMGWALAPRQKIFVDGRIEIFPDEIWNDFVAVTRGRADWQAILDRYGVDCLVLDGSGFHGDLLPQVQGSKEWIQVCAAGDAVLFTRRGAPDTLAAKAPAKELQATAEPLHK